MTMNSVASEARTCRFHLNARATWPPGLKDTLRALMDEGKIEVQKSDVRLFFQRFGDLEVRGAADDAVRFLLNAGVLLADVGAVGLAFDAHRAQRVLEIVNDLDVGSIPPLAEDEASQARQRLEQEWKDLQAKRAALSARTSVAAVDAEEVVQLPSDVEGLSEEDFEDLHRRARASAKSAEEALEAQQRRWEDAERQKAACEADIRRLEHRLEERRKELLGHTARVEELVARADVARSRCDAAGEVVALVDIEAERRRDVAEQRDRECEVLDAEVDRVEQQLALLKARRAALVSRR
ncbi:MAG: hypothetical protein QG668_195 [Patescibacteria group bacterium]|nr:hypothetical protein [Patescibacteria group bacterium]